MFLEKNLIDLKREPQRKHIKTLMCLPLLRKEDAKDVQEKLITEGTKLFGKEYVEIIDNLYKENLKFLRKKKDLLDTMNEDYFLDLSSSYDANKFLGLYAVNITD